MSKEYRGEPVDSSDHLVDENNTELNEFEFGLIIANNAFQRWMVRCMSACGVKNLSPVDILVLHNVNHREGSKRLSDICFTLNIEDSHTVSDALRKLVHLGFVEDKKSGKEVFYATTGKGVELCHDYPKVRQQCLTRVIGAGSNEMGKLGRLLRSLSGFYDQAVRTATSL